MVPEPWARMVGRTARMHRSTPPTLTSTTAWSISGVVSSTTPLPPMPALLTRMSTRPGVVDDAGHAVGHRPVVGDVHRDDLHRHAGVGRHGLELARRLEVAGRPEDPHALAGQVDGRGPPDAGVGARDDGDGLHGGRHYEVARCLLQVAPVRRRRRWSDRAEDAAQRLRRAEQGGALVRARRSWRCRCRRTSPARRAGGSRPASGRARPS